MNSNLPPNYKEENHYQECEDQEDGADCICAELRDKAENQLVNNSE